MNNCYHVHTKTENVWVRNIGIHDYYDMVSKYAVTRCKDCKKTLKYKYTGKSFLELNDFGQQMAGKTNRRMFPETKDASNAPLARRDFMNQDERKSHHHIGSPKKIVPKDTEPKHISKVVEWMHKS